MTKNDDVRGMKIRWSDLERGHRIVGGWTVVNLTSTHITVSDDDGEMSTFVRKDPWDEVEIETVPVTQIVESFGGHAIREDIDGGETRFFAWPDDPGFITAAQSHLAREHDTDAGTRTYEELKMLHEALHESGDNDHDHIPRP